MCQQIFFLRHGETTVRGVLLGQRIDVPLSEEGRRQAHTWAAVLRGVPFRVIVTSPALRARQTAEPFLGSGVTSLSLPHFHEISWGTWEGKSYEELAPVLGKQREAWAAGEVDYAAPEGESLRALLDRAHAGLQLITSLYPTGSLLIITHGQLLRALFCSLFGYPIAEQNRFHHKRGQLSWLVHLPEGHFYLRTLATDASSPF
ncbi:MAG: histidine phosphatase family protein [Bacteroidia bacterium]|nr:histidine phosphatase family protein [Bacteroidia bacterium]